ncbi:MAG TPA: hypothetical protein VGJ84_01835 [Polyangiaceae bacterium]|jgi:hypothetical protein
MAHHGTGKSWLILVMPQLELMMRLGFEIDGFEVQPDWDWGAPYTIDVTIDNLAFY